MDGTRRDRPRFATPRRPAGGSRHRHPTPRARTPSSKARRDGGVPIRPHIDLLLEQVDRVGPSAGRLFDVERVRQLAAEAYQLDDATGTCFVHGDLIPGNVLVQEGRVSGVLDWGSAGYGDPSRDLSPAWSILGPKGRAVFRELLGADEASWARGRALELCHAVDAVLLYVPRAHAVGDVMAATLDRILADR